MASNEGNGLFTSQASPAPCSWQECLGGHRWPLTVMVATCPGCSGPVLAIKQEMCPYCNEPARSTTIRTEIVPQGQGLVPRCKGVKSPGESLDVQLERHTWQEAQTTHKPFEVKETTNAKSEG